MKSVFWLCQRSSATVCLSLSFCHCVNTHPIARSRRQRRCDSHTHTHTVSQSVTERTAPPSCVTVYTRTQSQSRAVSDRNRSKCLICSMYTRQVPSGGAVKHAQSHGHSEDRWPVVAQCVTVSACKFTQAHSRPRALAEPKDTFQTRTVI